MTSHQKRKSKFSIGDVNKLSVGKLKRLIYQMGYTLEIRIDTKTHFVYIHMVPKSL